MESAAASKIRSQDAQDLHSDSDNSVDHHLQLNKAEGKTPVFSKRNNTYSDN